MRVHFEQLRVASMLEEKSMETELRLLRKKITKLQREELKFNKRDELLRLRVTASVADDWEPRVQREQETTHKKIEQLRKKAQQKMNNVEQVIVDRLDKDYGEVQEDYMVKLKDSREALDKAELLHKEKEAELKDIYHHVARFDHESESIRMENSHATKTATSPLSKGSLQQRKALQHSRTAVKQLWEDMATPVEHRLKFLETVVNEFSEADEYLLQHMQHYSDQLEKFT